MSVEDKPVKPQVKKVETPRKPGEPIEPKRRVRPSKPRWNPKWHPGGRDD